MADNALTGSHIASFKGIELHKNLSVIIDSRGPRVVMHEFPFKDGAKIETLGRKPHHTEWTITFTGPDWMTDFMTLANSIDDAPAGLLVHPIYGQMQVVCHGFDRATVNVVEATDTIVVPLTFTEDTQDIGTDQQQTTASVKQDTDAAVADFQDQTAQYTSPGASTACADFSGAALAFSSAALAAISDLVVDASLIAQLNGIGAQLAITQAAILADPVALASVAQSYDALAASEVVYSQCIALSEQISLETVSFTRLVCQGRTSISVLAQNAYGSDAINYIDLILTLNPGIIDPTNIPPGTIVVLPAQKVAA